MQKKHWLAAWPRYLLWSYALSVAGFYTIQWFRTRPDTNDYVRKLPTRNNAQHNPEDRAPSTPLVSIILPARNEERNIRRCVTSLLDQDYTNYEVIVVDDGSTDRTGEILDELVTTHPHSDRLFVLRLKDELPTGWAGKPHAIHMGVQEASGKWLLLTDADTWHAPNALRSTLAQAIQEQADLFTISTQQELPTFWDKTLMPMAFLGISMLYPPRATNDPASPVAIANGQYILLKRSVYDETGGYGRPELRATLLDDRDIAYTVKRLGYRLRFVEGQGLVSVRMYQNFGEIWRGWRKNSYLGNRGGLAFTLVQIIGLPMVTFVPFLLPLFTLLTGKRRQGRILQSETSAAMAVALTPLLAYRSWLNRQMDVPRRYIFTHPLAGAIFTGILAQSTWRILSGKGVDWRGRQYHNHKKEEQPTAF